MVGARLPVLTLLFPANPLAALVFEEHLDAVGARVAAVYAEFPGGLPTWFVHPGDPGSERQLRALGSAQAGRVPFLPPPEAVTVRLSHGGGDVQADGPTIAAAISEALRGLAPTTGPASLPSGAGGPPTSPHPAAPRPPDR